MFFDWMVRRGTKHGASIASLEEPFEAALFLRVYWRVLGSQTPNRTSNFLLFEYSSTNSIVIVG